MKQYKIKELYDKNVAVYITTPETWKKIFSDNHFIMTWDFYGPHFYFINQGSYCCHSKERAITLYSEKYLMIDETEIEELNSQSNNLILIL